MRPAHLLLSGGALALLAGALGYRRAGKTRDAVAEAVSDKIFESAEAKGGREQATRAASAAQVAMTPAAVVEAASKVVEAAERVEKAADAPPAVKEEAHAAADKAREVVEVAREVDGTSTPSAIDRIKAAVAEAAKSVQVVADKVGANRTIQLRLTTYWPWVAREDEKKREGGVNDRAGQPLWSLEDFFAGKSDYVSLSGDDAAWPYGQLVVFQVGGKTVRGRVTDTGGSFRGSGKLQRAVGREPIDVAVRSRSTKVPVEVEGAIVRGDNLLNTPVGRRLAEAGRTVAAVDPTRFKGQAVSIGALHALGAVRGEPPGFRPEWVPRDATAWDETGWWTSERFVPYSEALVGRVPIQDMVRINTAPGPLRPTIKRGSILFAELDNPAWRDAAEYLARAHGDGGAWEQADCGAWDWREENGSKSSAPLAVLKLVHPGMTSLLEMAGPRRDNDVGGLHMLGAWA